MKIQSKRKKDYSEESDRIKCKICGKKFAHLGSHIWHKHKVLAKDYKSEFGLPYNFSLINKEVYRKKVEKFEERREEILKNFNTPKSVQHRFVKGMKVPKGQYRSERAVKNAIKNLEKMNNRKWEQCPVCRMKFKHLPSHLYNKHKLVQTI